GAVWLLTADGYLWRHRDGGAEKWSTGKYAPRSVIADDAGLIWVGTRGALYSFDPAQVAVGRELPRGNEVAADTELLLASAKGGHWRLANGAIQHWTADPGTRVSFAYRWRVKLTSTPAILY